MSYLPITPYSGHYKILTTLAQGATSYLEVGVRDGASLFAVLDSKPDMRRLLLCDDWGSTSGGTGRGSHEHILPGVESRAPNVETRFLDGQSQITIPTYIIDIKGAGINDRFDLTNVDGGHDYEEAIADLRNVWLLTKHYMVVHDITFPSVWKAVCEFVKGVHVNTAEVSFGDQGTIVLGR